MIKSKVANKPLWIIILLMSMAMIFSVSAGALKEVWELAIGSVITTAIVWKIFNTYHKNLSTQQNSKPVLATPAPAITVDGSTPAGYIDQIEHQSLVHQPISKESKPVSIPKHEEEAFASFSLSESSEISIYNIPPPPQLDNTLGYRWIPMDQTVAVAGFEIKGGMIYVGMGLKAAYGQSDPALINPKLKVSQKTTVDISQALMNYSPSYLEISPDARRAYLQWLASGRADPLANIGYVFLFFYGLERRILLDTVDDPIARTEIPLIQAEIIRLLRLYAHNYSFKSYASSLLNYIDATLIDANLVASGIPDDQFLAQITVQDSDELPLKLKVGLGQLVVAEKPITAHWALAWALSDPTIFKRKPVIRCEWEFGALFLQKYQEAYEAGFRLRKNKTRLMVDYWPVSSGLTDKNFQQHFTGLPDVTALKTPINKLQKIVDDCTEVLEPYSRFIGRNPDKANALEALLLLPVHLWPYKFQNIIRRIRRETQQQPELLLLRELLSLFGQVDGLSRDRQLLFNQVLLQQRIGIEPDITLGAKRLKPDDKVALFNTIALAEEFKDTADYQLTILTIDLACLVAHLDGGFLNKKQLFIQDYIESLAAFSGSIKQRLRAHFVLSFEQPLPLGTFKKKLEPLALETRHSLAKLLIQLSFTDGAVASAKIKFLERIYKALGLESKQLYSDLHADESTTEQRKKTSHQSDPLITLDRARIDQLRQETAAVTALLSEVFSSDVFDEAENLDQVNDKTDMNKSVIDSDENPVHIQGAILGLDTDHAAFLRLLLTRMSWTKQDLERAAADRELMLEGALEQINDAVFDAFDAPLIEGEDPLEINQDILKELTI